MAVASSTYDHLYILRNLVSKDFKVRYRNMSLGILWSLVNPLIMMGVLTFVFTAIYRMEDQPHFPLFLLMGLVPYNFFTLAWATGTNAIVDNAGLVKKVPLWRELLPISVVLGNSLHYVIQLALLLTATFFIIGFNVHWLWLPFIVALQVVFVCGLSLITSSLDVYLRDIRYVVESTNLVLFWLVPIFYSFDRIGPDYRWLYEYNPVATVIFVTRRILLLQAAPPLVTMTKLTAVSFLTFAVGAYVFHRIKRNFADHL
jgi:ABC-type polysaccharide/polyol phosphate export permease